MAELFQDGLPYLKMLLSGILGALIGSLVTIWRTRYTSHSADLTLRVNELCDTIDQLADSCSRAATGIGVDVDFLLSSKSYCLALQARLDELMDTLENDFGGFWGPELQEHYLQFTEACTGGDFESFATSPESHIRTVIVTGGRLKDKLRSSRTSAH